MFGDAETSESGQLLSDHRVQVNVILTPPLAGEESPYKSKRFFGRPYGLPQNDNMVSSPRPLGFAEFVFKNYVPTNLT
jgi:hypothetical protein